MERPRILLVDDDEDILKMLKTALSKDCDITTAPDGSKALDAVRGQTFDAVVADHMMPGLTGVELLTQVAELQPQSVRVLVTASERVEDLRGAVNQARVHRFVNKPVRVMEFRGMVMDALTAHQLAHENQRLLVELKDKNDQLVRALGMVQDHERKLEREVEERTRELKVAMAELEKLALRDGLTGLYNHRFFQEALTQELSRASRHHHPVGLIFMDVDHFKNYNDLNGHPAGDVLLKELARILVDGVDLPEIQFRGRVSDIAARYGGEEFVVILPQTPKDGAVIRAERLRTAVAAYNFTGGATQPNGRVTISVGVACYPDDAITKADLVTQADQMVYRSKRSGRDRVSVWGRDAVMEKPST